MTAKYDPSIAQEIINQFGARPEMLVQILHALLARYGFIGDDTIRQLAKELNLSRADVYGVGGLLYSILTADTPHRGENLNALLYDMLTPVVLYGLESYGFCKRGEAAAFVLDGHIDAPHGRLPVNTHGGSLSEGYIHGFNHVLEGVRQMRGKSTCQIEGAEVALVAAAPVVPTSAILLRRG